MKRVKAGCIMQTLVFMQRNDGYLSRNSILEANCREVERYFQTLDRTHTRYHLFENKLDGVIKVAIY